MSLSLTGGLFAETDCPLAGALASQPQNLSLVTWTLPSQPATP